MSVILFELRLLLSVAVVSVLFWRDANCELHLFQNRIVRPVARNPIGGWRGTHIYKRWRVRVFCPSSGALTSHSMILRWVQPKWSQCSQIDAEMIDSFNRFWFSTYPALLDFGIRLWSSGQVSAGSNAFQLLTKRYSIINIDFYNFLLFGFSSDIRSSV